MSSGALSRRTPRHAPERSADLPARARSIPPGSERLDAVRSRLGNRAFGALLRSLSEDREGIAAKTGGGTTDVVAGDEVPSSVDQVLRSPGQALDPATRRYMEPRFAGALARVPGPGSGRPRGAPSVGRTDDPSEEKADQVSEQALAAGGGRTPGTRPADLSGISHPYRRARERGGRCHRGPRIHPGRRYRIRRRGVPAGHRRRPASACSRTRPRDAAERRDGPATHDHPPAARAWQAG